MSILGNTVREAAAENQEAVAQGGLICGLLLFCKMIRFEWMAPHDDPLGYALRCGREKIAGRIGRSGRPLDPNGQVFCTSNPIPVLLE
jgi:hypothetical protein